MWEKNYRRTCSRVKISVGETAYTHSLVRDPEVGSKQKAGLRLFLTWRDVCI